MTAASESPGTAAERGAAEVERIADLVYRMLLAELRLDNARAGRVPSGGG